MSNCKTLETIKKDNARGNYFSRMKVPEKVSLDHIFDSTLSAEKNREMALTHNENVEVLKEIKENENKMLFEKLSRDIADNLTEEFKLTKDDSKWLKDCIEETFQDLQELSEFITKNSAEHLSEFFMDLAFC